MEVAIHINTGCTAKLADLFPLQGNLKTLQKKDFEKLRQSLTVHGIVFPFFIWVENTGGVLTRWLVDGHQRHFTLMQMMKEGVKVPNEVPVVEVPAKDIDEAKRLILLASSRYARVSDESLYEFVEGLEGIDWDELKKEISIPDMSMSEFEKGWMKDIEDEPAPIEDPIEMKDDDGLDTIELKVARVEVQNLLAKLQPILDTTPNVAVTVKTRSKE